MKTTQYFISWEGLDKNHNKIAYGHIGIPFDSQRYKDFVKQDITTYVLAEASSNNNAITAVSIIAFNQV